ncbi:hypothetical protein Tco_1194710 [Tanacetum coccineum]
MHRHDSVCKCLLVQKQESFGYQYNQPLPLNVLRFNITHHEQLANITLSGSVEACRLVLILGHGWISMYLFLMDDLWSIDNHDSVVVEINAHVRLLISVARSDGHNLTPFVLEERGLEETFSTGSSLVVVLRDLRLNNCCDQYFFAMKKFSSLHVLALSHVIFNVFGFSIAKRCVMDPIDISSNRSKEKGKNVISSPVISSSSSSSDDNEGPSFLEFYDELSDSEDLTKAQQEKRGMFKSVAHQARRQNLNYLDF